MVMKNDLAFVLAGMLDLYEHQSTDNPNMPLRFLIYLAQEYQNPVEQAKGSLYGTKRIMLPAPQCVVFRRNAKAFLRKSEKHSFVTEKRKYRSEVLGMLLEEFDVRKYERSLREEGREEGMEKESARYSRLICNLLVQHRNRT